MKKENKPLYCDQCVSCGCYVPEGQMICRNCLEKLQVADPPDGKESKKKKINIFIREDPKK